MSTPTKVILGVLAGVFAAALVFFLLTYLGVSKPCDLDPAKFLGGTVAECSK